MAKKIIVTGGCGFIGSHVVDELVKRNHEVIVLDCLTYAGRLENISEAEESDNFLMFENIDIREKLDLYMCVKKHVPDVILNMAAETHVDNSIAHCDNFIDTNIKGTTNVLDVCIELGIPICHVSTDEIYGPASDVAFTEDSPYNPQNPYAATKAAGDQMIIAYANTHRLNYKIVRPSNNYGPRQNNEKFIPKLISCLLTGQKFGLYGDGSQEREWLYVKDCARFICNILESGKDNTIYNIGSEMTRKNVDMVQKIANIVKSDVVPLDDVVDFVADRPGHDKKYMIDVSLAKSEMLIDKFTALDDGLLETITFYKNKE